MTGKVMNRTEIGTTEFSIAANETKTSIEAVGVRSCARNGRPAKVNSQAARNAAYRRLAIVIIGLDVPTLAASLDRDSK